MKKLVTIFCITCISVCAIAQSSVRIGNYEFFVKKAAKDSTIQVFVEDDPRPPCPSENETRPKTNSSKYHKSTFFCGIGFILPEKSDDYYTILGGNSMNIDFGNMQRYQISRRFALLGTLQYSYYNYKLRDAASEPDFKREVLKNSDIDDIKKQVFRSHNIAAGAFTRFYLIPPKNRGNDGLYLDLGAQGDFAYSKYCKIKTNSEKYKYREGYVFNPFTASAIARIGWKGWKTWCCGSSPALFVRYRFTDAFNSQALPMDLPPITIGIQFF